MSSNRVGLSPKTLDAAFVPSEIGNPPRSVASFLRKDHFLGQ
jgi:hypothetical protein